MKNNGIPRVIKLSSTREKIINPKRNNEKAPKIAEIINKKRFKLATDILDLPLQFYDPDLEPTSLLLPKPEFAPQVLKRWCEHFYREDPIVAQCIDMHTQLPLSKLRLGTPKLPPDATEEQEELAKQVKEFFDDMLAELDFDRQLLNIAHQYWLLGNCFPYIVWNKDKKRWSKISCLDMENLEVIHIPFVDEFIIKWKIPKDFLELKRQAEMLGMTNPEYLESVEELFSKLPESIREKLNEILEGRSSEDFVVLNTNPFKEEDTVFHLAYMKKNYDAYGTPLIFRVLKLLILKDQLIKAHHAIASRNMEPINLIWGEDLGEEDLIDLRLQVEQAMQSPDYAVITNYEVHWDLITGNDRMTDLTRDFEFINDQIMIGMGMNATVLSGEGTYSNTYITQAIINERYARFREVFTDWIQKLFLAVAKANDFYIRIEQPTEESSEDVEKGEDPEAKEKKWWLIPEVRWTRTYITGDRDNKSFMQSLYSDGKLDLETYLSFFDLDGKEIKERVEEEIRSGFAMLPELVRNIASEVGRDLAPYFKKMMLEKFDIPKEIIEQVEKEQAEGGGGRW